MYRASLLLLLTVFLFSACHNKAVPAGSAEKKPINSEADYISQGYKKGTIVDMTGLDGCGFMIKLENGKTLEPTQLDDQFKKAALPVWVRFSIPKSLNSICMSGQLVNITGIETR